MLCWRKASRCSRGVSGVTSVYGSADVRLNLVMYSRTFEDCGCACEGVSGLEMNVCGSLDLPDQLPTFP